jgi:hypothetical protein
VASLFWPLGIGLVTGFVAGIRSSSEGLWSSDWWQTERWNRRWRGALAGGVRMAVLAAALAVAGILGLAAAHPHDVRAYFATVFGGSTVGGISLMVMTALALPNMAVWLLVPAMGGCVEASGSGVYQTYCFLGYGGYAGHPLGGPPTPSGYPALGTAPPAFYLFALIPLVAVVLGGAIAARMGGARTRGEATTVGAMAGVFFGIILLAAVVLASVTARFNGPLSLVSSGIWHFGPNPLASFQLGVLWGAAGGALGGALGGRTKARPT